MPEQLDFFGAPALNQCSQSQVMSALVKCCKLRRTDDAVYWLMYFTKHFPGQQYRQSRRLLIIAGEDNISVPVQMYAAEWIGKALAQKDTKKWFQMAATLVHLITATRDWWADTIGSYQILQQRRAQRLWQDMSAAEKKIWAEAPLEHHLSNPKEFLIACRARHEAWNKEGGIGGTSGDGDARRNHAAWLMEVARQQGNLSARLSAAVHYRHYKLLSGDNNYLAQAEHKLCFGFKNMGEEDFPKVKPETIFDSVEKARVRLCTPEKVPSWCLDGIHTNGSDRRFAGMMPNMLAVCNMYREYNRVDPADEQPKEFMSTTRLFKHLVKEMPELEAKGMV